MTQKPSLRTFAKNSLLFQKGKEDEPPVNWLFGLFGWVVIVIILYTFWVIMCNFAHCL